MNGLKLWIIVQILKILDFQEFPLKFKNACVYKCGFDIEKLKIAQLCIY